MQLLTRVKICGLCRPGDARMAADAGADYLGVILAPGGPRSRTEPEAAAIWAAAPDRARVGVFVDPAAGVAIAAAERLALSVVQLHGDEAPDVVERIRAAGPWRVWKAVRPRTGVEFRDAAEWWSGRVDGIIVDGYSREARGGTGRMFPWDEVAEHRSAVGGSTEFIVAGGLSPANVAAAIGRLSPNTVDVSSGVESERGIKSAERTGDFIAAARAAAQGLEAAETHG